MAISAAVHDSAVLIRDCTEADIGAITAIYGHAVATGTASFELQPPDTAEMTRRWRALVEAGFPYIVAERAGVVCGYAYAGAYRPRRAYRFTVENSVYVDPAAKGRGVGRQLLVALIAACEAKGFRQMIAVIGDSGNAASVGLHSALGFTPAGVLKAVGFKHGRWLDSVLMQRALGPGDQTLPADPEPPA